MLFALFVSTIVTGLALTLFLPVFWCAIVAILTFLVTAVIDVRDQSAVRMLIFACLNVFFRDIETRNSHTIPKKGPLILVCAPHASQFVDPMLVMSATKRPVQFLIAASSTRRRFIGTLARTMNSIPVERPQDIAQDGVGTVVIADMSVTGSGTQFTKQVKPKDQLKVKGQLYKVLSVEDDLHLTLKHHSDSESGSETEALTTTVAAAAFKILPHIDHHALYAAVFDRLKRGEVVGIFPEGGSHDNSALLPFKAGLAMLALGAMAEGAPPVRLIPVGLTYMHGHRFRSRAMVDFGAPLDIPERYVEMFRQGGAQRFKACDEVLALAQTAIESVTITAPDYDTMKVLWAARRLYKPEDLELSMEQTQQLTIRFSEAYTAMKDEPRVQALRQHVADYNTALLSAGMRDHEVVATTVIEPQELLLGACFRSILVVLETFILLPFMVMGLPILGACRLVASSKARQAAAKSSVKLVGRDVVATWKLLTALVVVPLMLMAYSLAAGMLISPRWGGVCWCLLPVVMLGSLHLYDHYTDTIKAIRGTFVALRSRERGIKLYKQRWQLKTQIRSLVAEAAERFELGPRMFDEVDFAGEAAPEDLK